MDTPLDVLHEFDRLWKPPPPSVTDAAVRPLPPPAPEIDADAELDGPMRSQAEVGATGYAPELYLRASRFLNTPLKLNVR